MSSSLHIRNQHRGRYELEKLCDRLPDLGAFIVTNPKGESTINFHDPVAVKCLNRALLLAYYDLDYWDIPDAFLCPAVPGRADYVHYLADLLAEDQGGKIPRGAGVQVLDVGTGANLIYPIIGSHEYRWSFVGAEVEAAAITAAQTIVDRNSRIPERVQLRQQVTAEHLLKGVVEKQDLFELVMCNPPFYPSAQAAKAETQRKRRNLGAKGKLSRNFGGQSNELWYPGGEVAFVGKLIAESCHFAPQVYWFTSLVAKQADLAPLKEKLQKMEVEAIREIPMAQGHKSSRILAWTFLSEKQREAWRAYRRW